MFCTACGKENNDADSFCIHCGSPQNVSGAAVSASSPLPTYDKIEGWLLIVGLGLFIAPFLLAYGIFDSLSLFWDGSLSRIDEEIAGMSMVIWFEIALDVILLLAALYLLFIFKEKKREFPKCYVWYLSASIVYLLADYVLVATLTTNNPEMQQIIDDTLAEQLSIMARVIIVSLIWIAYIYTSKRVAGTFVK